MNKLSLPMDVLGRVLLGMYFLIPGIMKIVGFGGMLAYMTQHSVPLTLPLLLITIVLEVGGGLALIAGWRTKTMAFLLAGLTLLINFFMHDFWNTYAGGSVQHELQNFIKNMAIFGGLLIVAARGAPRMSVDAARAAE
jgi:putative oxidoreductase